MTNCPACGAKLEEGQNKCLTCGYLIQAAIEREAEPIQRTQDLSKRLELMREKLKSLSKEPLTKPATPPLPTKDIEPEPEAEKLEAEKEVTEEELIPPPEEEVKVTEDIAEEAPIIETPEAKKESDEVPPLIEEVQEEELVLPEEIAEAEIPVEEYEAELEEPQIEEIEEEIEEEYEEVPVREFYPKRRGAVNGLGLPVSQREERERAEKIGYKVTSSDLKKKKKGIGKQAIIAIAVVLAIIFASLYMLLSRPAGAIPTIDGTFNDWDDAVLYESYFVSSDNPDLDFWACAVEYHHGKIYWYFATFDNLYWVASRITSYSLLIDADGSSTTGFSFSHDFGADLMVTISGSGGTLISKTVYEFSGNDRANWSAWADLTHTVFVASVDDQAEVSVSIPSGVTFSESASRYVCVAYDGVSEPSITPFFMLAPGVLIVTQTSLVPVSGEIQLSPGEDILQLDIEGYGEYYSIDWVDPILTNVEMVGSLSASKLSVERGDSMTVMVNTASISPGTLIGAAVTPESFETQYPSIMVLGDPAIGYAGSLPAGIIIDGCFADWQGLSNTDSEPIAPINQNIDLDKFGFEADTIDAFFYASVDGIMLSGVLIPVEERIIGPSGPIGPSVPLPRVTGEDILRIYIDIDSSNATGAPSPIIGEDIYPDYMIEIKGKNGQIIETNLYEWNLNWNSIAVSGISAAKDSTQIEVSAAKGAIGNDLSQTQIAMEMTDWIGRSDNSSPVDSVIDPFIIDIDGNVWGSADGTTWEVRSDVLPGATDLIDLTSDDSGYLYAMFLNGTVYKSIDSALSWSRIIDGTPISWDSTGISCDRSLNLYMTNERGEIYRCDVTGGSWTYTGIAPSQNNFYVDIDWANGTDPSSTVLYAIRTKLTPLTLNMYRSTDGGASWSADLAPTITEQVQAISAVRVGSEDRIYALQLDGYVHVSNNSGVSWDLTNVSTGGGPQPCVDIDTDEQNNVWVTRERGDIYKLDVSTWTWTTVFSLSDKNNIIGFSTAPIPEFEDMQLIGAIIATLPIIFLMRINARKKCRSQKHKELVNCEE